MKIKLQFVKFIAGIVLAVPVFSVQAIPFFSDGSDGAFNPLVSQTIILDDVAPDGIFNFTSINIPTDVTIRFQRNSLNTAVVFGATSDVVINGSINLSTTGRLGGAGGGDGGIASNIGNGDGSAGTGLSSGDGGTGATGYSQLGRAGGGGGMATPGLIATSRTGSPPAVGGAAVTVFPEPIQGGSGGGAGGRGRFVGEDLSAGNGGGAGGGLQISTIGNIDIAGSLISNGAHGGVSFANVFSYAGPGGGGSGGNFELNATNITIGNEALIQAIGGAGGGLSTEPVSWDPFFYSSGANGGEGFVFFDTDNLVIDTGAVIEATALIPGEIPPGATQSDPVLPDNTDGAPWDFNLSGDFISQFDGDTIWFDPEVAIGFDYEILSGSNFASITAPVGFGDDIYDLFLINPATSLYELIATLEGGIAFNILSFDIFGGLLSDGVDQFRIAGIETGANVIPDDALGFPTGMTFVANSDGSFSDVSFSMTPLIESIGAVPEPTAFILVILGGLSLGFYSRRYTG